MAIRPALLLASGSSKPFLQGARMANRSLKTVLFDINKNVHFVLYYLIKNSQWNVNGIEDWRGALYYID